MAIPDILWAIEQKQLSSNEKLVLIILANRKNGKTGRCNPSLKTLSNDCGIKKTALLTAINGLEEKNLLKIIRQREGLVNLPNQYELGSTSCEQRGSPLNEPVVFYTDNGSTSCEQRGSPLNEPKPVIIKPVIEPIDNLTIDTSISINSIGDQEGHSAKKFKKPTVLELQTFCNETNITIDCQHFYDHYESNGWKVGGKAPMKNWQSAVRNWACNDKLKIGGNYASNIKFVRKFSVSE